MSEAAIERIWDKICDLEMLLEHFEWSDEQNRLDPHIYTGEAFEARCASERQAVLDDIAHLKAML